MTSPDLSCSNCGTTTGVAHVSFDLDLPTIALCRICRITIVSDPVLFEKMGRGGR